MADWIQNWQEKKIHNREKFTLVSQTASAFVRTLKYHVSPIEEAASSGNIIKRKTLLKDDIDISNIIDSNMEHDENIETLLHHVDLSRCSEEIVTLSEESREVAIYIAGYIAKNWKNALVTAAIDYWSLTVELATLIFCLFKFYQEEVLQSH